MDSGLTDQDLEEMRSCFERFPDVDEVILFGSRAKGTYRRGSDVDLALIGRVNPNTVVSLLDLLNEESAMPYFFDVLDYEAIEHAELREHIQRVGKSIYRRK